MPKNQKRHKTQYPGVYYYESKRVRDGTEKVYYIIFKKAGRVYEEKVGFEFRDNMTPSRAAGIRKLRKDTTLLSPKAVREIQKAEAGTWTIDRIWCAYAGTRPVNKSTEIDLFRYRKYLYADFGHKKPDELLALDIERLKKTLRMQGLSDQTRKHVVGILQRIVNFGFNHHLSPPLAFKISIPAVENVVTESLSSVQLKALLAALDGHHDQNMANIVRLALTTGMRRGEILSLRWNDVDFTGGWIYIKSPQSGKVHKLPMNAGARAVLHNIARGDAGDFVFPDTHGRQRRDISRGLRKIRTAAGLPDSFRMLNGIRHYFALSLAESGMVSLHELQLLMKHSTPRMTRRYMHLYDARLKKATENNTVMLTSEALDAALHYFAAHIPSPAAPDFTARNAGLHSA